MRAPRIRQIRQTESFDPHSVPATTLEVIRDTLANDD